MTIRARIGERYRVTSANFPEYGIGTVVRINSDLSGIMQSKEKGVFYFQHFDISTLAESLEDTIDESVKAVLGEIRLMELNRITPAGAISSFGDLHDFMDPFGLIRKHVPRVDGAGSEEQSQLDNAIINLVSLWLSLNSSVMT